MAVASVAVSGIKRRCWSVNKSFPSADASQRHAPDHAEHGSHPRGLDAGYITCAADETGRMDRDRGAGLLTNQRLVLESCRLAKSKMYAGTRTLPSP